MALNIPIDYGTGQLYTPVEVHMLKYIADHPGKMLRNCLEEYEVYNPKAVVSAMNKRKIKSYWSETGTYEAIVPLINMNFDGLNNCASHSRYFSDELDAQFFLTKNPNKCLPKQMHMV